MGQPNSITKKDRQAPGPQRRLLTVSETASILGISPQTIYNGISRRSERQFPIKPKRWGRKVLFDSRDVEAFIENMPYDEGDTLES